MRDDRTDWGAALALPIRLRLRRAGFLALILALASLARLALAAPPGAPTNLKAEVQSNGSQINVSWWQPAPGTFPVSSYEVFRSTCATCPESLIHNTAWPSTYFFSDTAITPGVWYIYRVGAVDTMNGRGPLAGPTQPKSICCPNPIVFSITTSALSVVMLPSDSIVYQLHVRNTCTSSVYGIVITTTPDSIINRTYFGSSFYSWPGRSTPEVWIPAYTQSITGTWQNNLQPAWFTGAPLQMRYTLGVLGPSRSAFVAFALRVLPGPPAPLPMGACATAMCQSQPLYDISGCLSATSALLSRAAVPELSVVQSQTPASPGPGSPITYRMVIRNTGADTLSALTIIDTISPILISVTTDEPPGFPAPTVTSTPSGTRYEWAATGLNFLPGMTYTLTLSGTVGSVGASTPVSSTLLVLSTGFLTTGVHPSNPVGFIATIDPPPAVAVTLIQQPTTGATLPAGSPVMYQIRITNTGAVTVTDLRIIDTVPSGIVIVATRQPAGFPPPTLASAGSSGTRFEWTGSGLSVFPGTTLTLTLTGWTPAAGTFTHRALVHAGAKGASIATVSPAVTITVLPPPVLSAAAPLSCPPVFAWSRTLTSGRAEAVALVGPARDTVVAGGAMWTTNSDWRIQLYATNGTPLGSDTYSPCCVSRHESVLGLAEDPADPSIFYAVGSMGQDPGTWGSATWIVRKYAVSGGTPLLVWSVAQPEGPGGSTAAAAAVSPGGDLTVVGIEKDAWYPSTTRAVLRRYAPDGTVRWSRTIGLTSQWPGIRPIRRLSIAADIAGAIIVGGAMDPAWWSGAALEKWSADGERLWIRQSPHDISSIATDPAAMIAVAGPASLRLYDGAGTLQWSRSLRGGYSSTAVTIGGTGAGATLYVATGSSTWQIQGWSAGGSHLWSRDQYAQPGTCTAGPAAIRVDPSGTILVAGLANTGTHSFDEFVVHKYLPSDACAFAHVAITPAVVEAGQPFTVSLTVTKGGSSSAAGVVPAIQLNYGNALVAPVTGPVPTGPISLAGGSAQTFEWMYNATGAGAVEVTVSITGSESGTGIGIASAGTAAADLYGAVAPPPSGCRPRREWMRGSEYSGAVYDVAITPQGGIIAAGVEDPTPFAYGVPSLGDEDWMVRAWDPTGRLVWSHRSSGPAGQSWSRDEARAVAVDAAGDVYVAGSEMAPSGTWPLQHATLRKYLPDGRVDWTYRFPHSSYGLTDCINDVAVSPDGSLVVTGFLHGDYFTLDAPLCAMLVAKISPAGTLIWQDIVDGPGFRDHSGLAVGVDASGSIFVISQMFNQPVNVVVPPCVTPPDGEPVVRFRKYAPDGTPLWSMPCAVRTPASGGPPTGLTSPATAAVIPNPDGTVIASVFRQVTVFRPDGTPEWSRTGWAGTRAIARGPAGRWYLGEDWLSSLDNGLNPAWKLTGAAGALSARAIDTRGGTIATASTQSFYVGPYGGSWTVYKINDTDVCLNSALSLSATTVAVGEWVTVALTVTNAGSGTATVMVPSLLAFSGTGYIEVIGGPVPVGPVELTGGSSITFAWTVSSSGVGLAGIAARTLGFDLATGSPLAAGREAEVRVSPSNGPPAAPTSLSAIPESGGVSLAWTPPPPGAFAISAYEVYRATCSLCGGVPIAMLPASATIFLDATASPGSAYFYAVRCLDVNGSFGALSMQAATGVPCMSPAWVYGPSMPTVRSQTTATVLGGRIYVAGGYNGSFLNTFERLDPSVNLWEIRAPMPFVRQGVGLAAVNGQVIMAGGGWAGLVFGDAAAYDPGTDAWTVLASMPTPRYGPGAATVGGTVFVIGGEDQLIYQPANEAFDPATGTWSTRTPMPTARTELGIGVIGGTIYVVGGWNFGALAVVEAYDPATDSWWTCAPLPAPRSGLAVAVVGGTLYAIGGDLSGPLTVVDAYDPATNTWVSLCGMQTARAWLAAAAVGGSLYAIGGTAGGYTGSVETAFVGEPPAPALAGPSPGAPAGISAVAAGSSITVTWDPALPGAFPVSAYEVFRATCPGCGGTLVGTVSGLVYGWTDAAPVAGVGYEYAVRAVDTIGQRGPSSAAAPAMVPPPCTSLAWTPQPAMPTTRSQISAAVLGATIFVAGGYNGGFLDTVEAFDVRSGAWTTLAPMPTIRQGVGLAAMRGRIWAAGGGIYGLPSGAFEMYDPATGGWTALAPLPTPRYAPGAAAVGGTLYVIGGEDQAMYHSVVEAWDSATGTWVTRAPMPTARTEFGIGVVAGKIYAVGGWNWGPLASVEMYDTATDTWTAKAPLPAPRTGVAVAVIGGTLYAIGGDSGGSLTTVAAYDPATDSWTSQCDLSSARSYLAAAAVGGTLYAIGGWNLGYLSSVESAWVSGLPIDLSGGVGLTVSITVSHPTPRAGDTITVTVRVRNNGWSLAIGVRAGLEIGGDPGLLFAVSAPGPSGVTLVPGAECTLVWTYRLTSNGTASFTAVATGTDPADGDPVSSPPVTAIIISPPVRESPVVVTGGATGPVNPSAGEQVTVAFHDPVGGPTRVVFMTYGGRVVHEVTVTTRAGAWNRLRWDLRNRRGRFISPGVYGIVIRGPGVRARASFVAGR